MLSGVEANVAHREQSRDDELTFTSKGIPISLRPCFQEYRLENLGPERDAFTIIERTLALGDRREVRWLFRRYGRERLVEWARRTGWRRLSRQHFRLWLNYFGIREYESSPWGRGA